ncbi:hypothetical protein F0M03_11840 [Vibrio parahaemolyticus]|uniref:hypothetical protein n=1 Tax=Vibrio parahaemolyticus TaxID=670 RepID=UPI001299E024|nr:hypothetical protein [Vibrio parahaemolyticus]EJB8584233.1 hypothetical protein [Vibrio parahaemolyticus]MRE03813.1 hypothetical protein [Vibrio parahaemolyticus]
MYLLKGLVVAFAGFLLGCQSTSTSGVVIPPNGGAAISVGSGGWWLSGINKSGMEGFSVSYPEGVSSEHMHVVNAGFYVADAYGKVSQVINRYTISFLNLPNKKLYTKAIIENPQDAAQPIIYTHYILSHEKSTNVTHGPLEGIEIGRIYKFKFELYSDEEMTKLVDTIHQDIVSPLSNVSGCTELEPDYKKLYMGNIRDPKGNLIPIDKLMLSCVK